jgi:hypothetical protein
MGGGNREETPDLLKGQSWVLSSLEHDQLAKAKKHFIPRRRLKGGELVILWGLRAYLIFMMAVVVYQVWVGSR